MIGHSNVAMDLSSGLQHALINMVSDWTNTWF